MQTTATTSAKPRAARHAPAPAAARKPARSKIIASTAAKAEAARRVTAQAAPVVKARKPRTGKTQDMINLLSRPKGATMKDLMKASGWNEQSLKWFMQGTLGTKKGLKVIHEGEGAKRVYRIDVPEAV